MSKTNNPYWPYKAPSRIDVPSASIDALREEIEYCEDEVWYHLDDPSGIAEAYKEYLSVLLAELARRG